MINDAASLFAALQRSGEGAVLRADIADGLRRLDISVCEKDIKCCLQALEVDEEDCIGWTAFLRWLGEPPLKSEEFEEVREPLEVGEEPEEAKEGGDETRNLAYVEPSEPSQDGGSSAPSREESPASAKAQPAREVRPPSALNECHRSLLAAVPSAWQRFLYRKVSANEHWAQRCFTRLSVLFGDHIPREALATKELEGSLQDCFGEISPGGDVLRLLVGLAFERADRDEDGQLSRGEFTSFAWSLKRLTADTDLEVQMALMGGDDFARDTAELWKEVVDKARQNHVVWADTAFRILDMKGQGELSTDDLCRPAFEHLLLQQFACAHLAETKSREACLRFVLWRCGLAGETQGGRISRADFEELTWQLVRLDLDVLSEVQRLTETIV